MRDWGVMRWLVAQRSNEDIFIFELITLPGDLIVIAIALAALLLWELNRARNFSQAEGYLLPPNVWSLIAIIVGGLSLIVALESLFALNRPPEELRAVAASPYSFPSGHTMAATVTWAAIAWWHRPQHRPVRIALVFGVVAAVGLARMALGLHYLPDILAGIGFGVLYLFIARLITFQRPKHAFDLAIIMATAAAVLSGASSRGILAFIGTLVWFAIWRTLEHPTCRSWIRSHWGRDSTIQ